MVSGGRYAEKKTEVLMSQQGRQGQVAEEQIGEVRTVKSLGHEDHVSAATICVRGMRVGVCVLWPSVAKSLS